MAFVEDLLIIKFNYYGASFLLQVRFFVLFYPLRIQGLSSFLVTWPIGERKEVKLLAVFRYPLLSQFFKLGSVKVACFCLVASRKNLRGVTKVIKVKKVSELCIATCFK